MIDLQTIDKLLDAMRRDDKLFDEFYQPVSKLLDENDRQIFQLTVRDLMRMYPEVSEKDAALQVWRGAGLAAIQGQIWALRAGLDPVLAARVIDELFELSLHAPVVDLEATARCLYAAYSAN